MLESGLPFLGEWRNQASEVLASHGLCVCSFCAAAEREIAPGAASFDIGQWCPMERHAES